jgi:hypothetical protein
VASEKQIAGLELELELAKGNLVAWRKEAAELDAGLAEGGPHRGLFSSPRGAVDDERGALDRRSFLRRYRGSRASPTGSRHTRRTTWMRSSTRPSPHFFSNVQSAGRSTLEAQLTNISTLVTFGNPLAVASDAPQSRVIKERGATNFSAVRGGGSWLSCLTLTKKGQQRHFFVSKQSIVFN